jgi:hypothetical protein
VYISFVVKHRVGTVKLEQNNMSTIKMFTLFIFHFYSQYFDYINVSAFSSFPAYPCPPMSIPALPAHSSPFVFAPVIFFVFVFPMQCSSFPPYCQCTLKNHIIDAPLYRCTVVTIHVEPMHHSNITP